MLSSQTGQGAVPVAARETTFTGFRRLPTELRLMIWEEFVRTPRIIYIGSPSDPFEVDGRFAIEINGIVREQACPLLRVSRESRHVAMKASLLLFSIQYPPLCRLSKTWATRGFGIRNCDVVVFDSDGSPFYKMAAEGETDKIANIIINVNVCCLNSATPLGGCVAGGFNLTQILGNEQCLKNMYCLIRDTRAWARRRHFELDDLRDFAPSQFPLYEQRLTAWPGRFREFPESLRSERHDLPDFWKTICALLNVGMEERKSGMMEMGLVTLVGKRFRGMNVIPLIQRAVIN
ncbi:hypothetical protein F5B21DRAFT_258955 [Xylaria acuta]|nr:hypothetical protein F5B21DRAFT_258955 [Xylaria acuta]